MAGFIHIEHPFGRGHLLLSQFSNDTLVPLINVHLSGCLDTSPNEILHNSITQVVTAAKAKNPFSQRKPFFVSKDRLCTCAMTFVCNKTSFF